MTTADSWREYLAAFDAFVHARMKVNTTDNELVTLIRQSLRQPSERSPALDFLQTVAPKLVERVVPDIINVALFVNGQTEKARQLLSAAPHDVVVTELMKLEPEILARRDYEEYACLMELWTQVNNLEHAIELAHHALRDSDEDLRSVAESFLQSHGIIDLER